MINFKAKHLVNQGSAMYLPGDGGNYELVIITAWGLDARSALVVVGVTHGNMIIHHSSPKRMILANVLAVIERVVEKWSYSGSKPDAYDKERLQKQRKKLMDMLAEEWS